ncbi:MAG: SEC-C domain-containing protein [Rubrivivax sp.]|nr:SEC-C domain-containing protein [Rubrivivax sp.]
MATRTPRDSTNAEIDALAALCERLGGFDDRVSLGWVDGYLTALAAAPYAVPPETAVERMAGDAWSRCFGDPDDDAQARAVLAARTSVLVDQLDPEMLLDDPDALRLAPLMDLWSDEDRERLVREQGLAAEDARELQSGQAWADGYLQACRDFEGEWVPSHRDDDADAVHDEMLSQVAVLGLEVSSPELAAWIDEHHHQGVAPTRDDLMDEACYAVQDLRLWWLDHAPLPATRRVAAQPGRNDPCPCGSGLKFKKCHGRDGKAGA